MKAAPYEQTRREIDRKARKDRMLHDSIILEVWCRIHQPQDVRQRMGDGWDTLLPSYRYGWYTARQELSEKALNVIDDFIGNATQCLTPFEGKKHMAASGLWNDCQLTALNALYEAGHYGFPAVPERPADKREFVPEQNEIRSATKENLSYDKKLTERNRDNGTRRN